MDLKTKNLFSLPLSLWNQGAFILRPDGTLFAGLGDFKEKEELSSQENGFFLPGFFLQRPRPYVSFSTQFWGDVPEVPEDKELKSPFTTWAAPEEVEFKERIQALLKEFQETELKKAVPLVRWTSSWRPETLEIQNLARRLFRHHLKLPSEKRGYAYGFWNKEKGFLGYTPELLFHQEKNQLKTMALAGTAWQEKGIELLKDPKENWEHQLVVEEILHSLSALGKFSAGKREVHPYGPIAHLRTSIKGELKSSVSLKDICSQLHPTPALGGYPRKAASRWLSRQPEAQWRGDFGGPFGLQEGREESLSVVLIRGIYWSAEGSQIPCGCGVVEGSRAELEWTELRRKKESLLQLLNGEHF